mmetsp:Transcript_26695/g.25561  ORF Transcript_26695/g.25561 Transcript_26695/m.25561 type:complete len:141 (+) Transcript_26695:130-552(+)
MLNLLNLSILVALVILSCTSAFTLQSRPITSSATRIYHTYSSRETAQAAIKASKIMVFSKTTCPFCAKAKAALTEITPMFSVVELNVVKDGAEQQAALAEMTGQSTVPSIFVNGKHFGGCDAILAAIAGGELQKELALAL